MHIRIPTLLLAFAASASIACTGTTNNDVEAGSDVIRTDATRSDSDDTGSSDDSEVTPSGARDFTLHGRELTAHAGRPLGVFVTETTGGREMGLAWTASLAGPEVELRLPDLVPEGDYRADIFVDGNGNGTYDGPATDPSWSVPIPNLGSATASFSASDATVDLSTLSRTPRSNFTATLSGFTADEAGHWFELRVIDPGTRATVGAYANAQLPSGGSLSITLPGILDDGTAYQVDFWVDMDGNSTYSGPAGDHTWRATLEGGSLTWTHSDSYTELDWR